MFTFSFCETVCYRTVVLSVCNVGVLWPNDWIDQDETWHRGRPRPQFFAHVCCSQTAGWIKMPLGMEIGLGPGHIVLDVTQTILCSMGIQLPLKRGTAPPTFRPMSIVAKLLPISATA